MEELRSYEVRELSQMLLNRVANCIVNSSTCLIIKCLQGKGVKPNAFEQSGKLPCKFIDLSDYQMSTR